MHSKSMSGLISAVAVVGCASVGQEFSMADVDSMRPGVTTYSEAVATLGKPVATSVGASGSMAAVWSRSSANFLGGASGKTVSILFGADGKMIRVISRSEIKTN